MNGAVICEDEKNGKRKLAKIKKKSRKIYTTWWLQIPHVFVFIKTIL